IEPASEDTGPILLYPKARRTLADQTTRGPVELPTNSGLKFRRKKQSHMIAFGDPISTVSHDRIDGGFAVAYRYLQDLTAHALRRRQMYGKVRASRLMVRTKPC